MRKETMSDIEKELESAKEHWGFVMSQHYAPDHMAGDMGMFVKALTVMLKLEKRIEELENIIKDNKK